MSKETNIATLYSALGYVKYITFCKEAKITFDQEDNDPIIVEESMINEDETNYELINLKYVQPYPMDLNTNKLNGHTIILIPINSKIN